MHPIYYRACAYGADTNVHFDKLYTVYSTPNFDMCTYNQSLQKLLNGKTPKEIRATCKECGCKLIRINNLFSKIAKPTKELAVEDLLRRKKAREYYLRRDISEVLFFLNHVKDLSIETIIKNSEDDYKVARS